MNVPHEQELVKVIKSMGYDAMPHLPGSEARKIPPPAIHFYDIFIIDEHAQTFVLSVTESYIRAKLTDKRAYRYRKRFKYEDYASIYDLLEAAFVYTDKVMVNSMWRKLEDDDKTIAFEGLYTVIKSPRKSEYAVRGYGGMISGVYTS
jgi:hypothetical protein